MLNTAGQNEMVGDAMPNLADFAAVAARSAVHHAHEPSRILIVRHVATDVPDSELEDIFKVCCPACLVRCRTASQLKYA